ncbi:rhodanese-like domain-containing protein [Thioalkalivibrio halophilus]|uniref:Rhodanese-like domain-containing protein n=1 Tax=Thioalkalivibrio halophilus TaxID=252474 RepID=A0A1V2ZV72_9GAMM|nr:rhodanese-like domain-containing protein [Thioalkalivibrio halophilus]
MEQFAMFFKPSRLTLALFSAGLLALSGQAAASTGDTAEPGDMELNPEAEGYEPPGRSIYFYVDALDLDELAAKYARDEVHVIDVRTRYEYETLRIDGARHVSIDDEDFVDKVLEIHEEDPDKPVAFYCRGHTCFMSYQAVERMKAAGFDDAMAMDYGIFDWAEHYPEDTALFGEAPIERADLIDFNEFRERLLPPMEFSERAQRDNARVLDIRRPFEQDQIGLFLNSETNIPAGDTEALEDYLEQARTSDTPLLIYDITGHEIKAFQYTLEEYGIEDYYFMEGGFKAFQEKVLQ